MAVSALLAAIASGVPAGAANGPAAVAPVPSITGVVRVVTRSSRRLASAGAYPGRAVTIAPEHDPSELANVVVFVEAPPESSVPMTTAIRQTDEEFVPHLAAITTGSTVEFPNDDLLFHNVFSLSRTASFDLGRYPRGRSKSRVFTEPGIVKVYCHLHSHMSALIRVFDHPHFAIPDAAGRFVIAGLAPGTYTVVAWHERVGNVTTAVSVKAGEPAELSFSLPIAEDE
jgi:plastocyanin